MKKKLSILVVLMFILISTFTFAGYQVDFGYVAGDLNFSNGTIRNFNTLEFNTSGGPGIMQEGLVYWNPIDNTLDVVTGDSQIIQVGRELSDIGKNVEGALVSNGNVVYLSGSSGTRGEFMLADASNFSKSSLIGVLTADCNINAECPVTLYGLVRDINTSSYSAGDKLYLSATTPGEYVTTAPGYPNNDIWVATVIRSHATEGSIYVNPRIDVSNGVVLNSLGVVNDFRVGGEMIGNFSFNDGVLRVYDYGNVTCVGCNSSEVITSSGAPTLIIGQQNDQTDSNLVMYSDNGTFWKEYVDYSFDDSLRFRYIGAADGKANTNSLKIYRNGDVELEDGHEFYPTGNIIQSDDKYYNIEDVYISAGSANQLLLGTNIYQSNGANVFPGAKEGAFLFINDAENLVYYTHNGSGGFNTIFTVAQSIDETTFETDLTINSQSASALSLKEIASGGETQLKFLDNTGTNAFGIIKDTSDQLFFYDFLNSAERLRIDNTGAITMLQVYGDTVGGVNRDLYIDNTGLIGYVSSSERYKKNIKDLNNTNWIYNLRPVSFDYIDESKGINKIGLIAEEVEKINPNIVSYNILDNGSKQVETVTYSDLVVPLLKELQEANNRITYLEEILSAKYPEIVPQYQVSEDIEYVEQLDFTKPIECRANNIKYCFTEEACLFYNGYWDGSKCSELKDDKYCSSTNLQYCITESACIDALGVWQNSECITAEI